MAGQLASDFVNGLAPDAQSGNPNIANSLEMQSRYTLKNLEDTVKAGGCDIAKDAVRIWQWFTSPYPTMEEFKAGNTWPRISITPISTRATVLFREPRPASTGMGIRELLVKGTVVEVDPRSRIDDGGKASDSRRPKASPVRSPVILPPFAAVTGCSWRAKFLNWVGDYEPGSSRRAECARQGRPHQSLPLGRIRDREADRIRSLEVFQTAEAAGDVARATVKADVYIGDPSDYAGMERVWKRWFPDNLPARCVIPVYGARRQRQPGRSRADT